MNERTHYCTDQTLIKKFGHHYDTILMKYHRNKIPWAFFMCLQVHWCCHFGNRKSIWPEKPAAV